MADSDWGAAAGIGVSAATGNWIGAGIAAVGLGMSLFGGLSQAGSSREYAEKSYAIQSQISANENLVNNQREDAMRLNARRNVLEQFRNTQRMAARATAAATTQGAQFGSGLAGGLGQISAQGAYNVQGLSQNLEIGENIFGINRTISGEKLQLAQLQSQYGQTSATNQGLMSLGSGIMSAGPAVGRLSQGIGNPFGSASGVNNFNSGNAIY